MHVRGNSDGLFPAFYFDIRPSLVLLKLNVNVKCDLTCMFERPV